MIKQNRSIFQFIHLALQTKRLLDVMHVSQIPDKPVPASRNKYNQPRQKHFMGRSIRNGVISAKCHYITERSATKTEDLLRKA